MKMRTGFVSNSSSSSFVVYGINVDDINELAKQLGYKIENIDEDNEHLRAYDLDDIVSEKLGKGWKISGGSEGDYPMLGRAYQSMGDDETGKQFRDSVKNKLTEIMGKEINPSHIEEGWYDG